MQTLRATNLNKWKLLNFTFLWLLLSFNYTKWAGKWGKIVPNVNHLETILKGKAIPLQA
jgi:hypothetical protein